MAVLVSGVQGAEWLMEGKVIGQDKKSSRKQGKVSPHVFGIRHLSPAGAYFVRKFLDKTVPELVLIEGPSDFTELLEDLGK